MSPVGIKLIICLVVFTVINVGGAESALCSKRYVDEGIKSCPRSSDPPQNTQCCTVSGKPQCCSEVVRTLVPFIADDVNSSNQKGNMFANQCPWYPSSPQYCPLKKKCCKWFDKHSGRIYRDCCHAGWPNWKIAVTTIACAIVMGGVILLCCFFCNCCILARRRSVYHDF
ncbi:uncharacterized protein LOC141904181 [Tubulanus polymorphus]|uniref:uncharacterized protein LOC141904181 n=1 Tax=Tubulanus polymorphus TaxID=672921 RepID=UPI003DA29707